MKKIAVFALLAALSLSACRGSSAQEKADLSKKVADLQEKVTTLEADNARLRKQIELLTETTDNLTQVLKAQHALGKLPDPTPAPAATPK